MKKIVMMTIALVSMTQAMATNTVDKTFDKGSDRHRTYRMDRHYQHDGDITDMMVTKLGLDKAQTEKLKQLNTEYADLFQRPGHDRQMGRQGMEMRERKMPTEAERKQMKEKMDQRKARQEEYNTKLKSILTKEQYAQYEQMRPARPAHPKEGFRGGRPQGGDYQRKDKE